MLYNFSILLLDIVLLFGVELLPGGATGTTQNIGGSCQATMTSTGGALGKFAKGRSSNSFLYFAFGSNLSSERIRVQNPSAQYVASAVLDGYQLDFKTYSTVPIAKGVVGKLTLRGQAVNKNFDT